MQQLYKVNIAHSFKPERSNYCLYITGDTPLNMDLYAKYDGYLVEDIPYSLKYLNDEELFDTLSAYDVDDVTYPFVLLGEITYWND